MSYFTALVVRLGLYFGGLPLPLRKEGSHEKLYYSEKLGGSARGDIPFRQLSQCFHAAMAML